MKAMETGEVNVDSVTDDVLSRNNMDREAVKRVVSSILEEIDEKFPFRECKKCQEFLENGIENGCPSCGHSEDQPAFREHQQEIVVESAVALWIEGYDNVAIEGPTGIGKSAANYTLGRMARDAFYTTPQKSLRNQLSNDEHLKQGMSALKGRLDYICRASGQNCSDCPVNKSSDKSCLEQEGCTYWDAKVNAMNTQIAATTFAYLIVDKYLPVFSDDGSRISFGDRDLGICDECHTLEEQVASLFAGFKVSPWSIPPDVYGDAGKQIERKARRKDIKDYKQIDRILEKVSQRAKRYAKRHKNDDTKEEEVDKCENFLQKYNWFREEVKEGRHWVVETQEVNAPNHNGKTMSVKLKPIKVDKFLKNFVWSRADKWVLSTATMPYRKNPEKWFKRLGLEGKTKVIRKPMPFPKENRPIHTGTIIDKFSGGNDYNKQGDLRPDIIGKIRELSRVHEGEKGLIHTASYKRANELADALGTRAMVHDRELDAEEQIKKWQESNVQILCSPSMMEGVDLKYDMCRWQVLLKIPYPNSHTDSRVAYMLNELSDWSWYYTTTGLQVFQSVGRAVRAVDDQADFYVLDKSFNDIVSKTSPPNWVVEAIVK